MAQIFVTQQNGESLTLEAQPGRRLMEVLRDGGTTVEGTCGGACSCGSCHVYVEEAWLAELTEPKDEEREMIEAIGEVIEVRPNSRLACQIQMSDALDGLALTIAEAI
ncbi:MAG: 2Fe-2S iron-sulfur cluster-binding protein [Brevundimonas sp.]|uniref:2Fe-2S iron-sulfur cluster-binding protein n=1 Tax=Brevundimonas sp. TaxID=1871086 RepID=UPI0024886D0C|nr:2Fe-2S iron-sulfur cluster-binding protein [Brevundimonas sp.]MDI1328513.1 2Fe-2S iron-sulfur cluster-binding protein [Brevundimonas sp.]